MKISDAQKIVKNFTIKNNWDDIPSVDKFDHLHEELVEMSRLLRYKNISERIDIINTNKDQFVDGIGDLFFGLCRLANQLNVDIENSFEEVRHKIEEKYKNQNEIKPV